jgi:Ser/Thr protein kinase RdoA (MazF antagonist)
LLEHAGRLWDISTWLPGSANFHAQPSAARLQAAGAALARLHVAWQSAAPRTGPCPVVARRLETLRRWRELVASGWRPAIAPDDPVAVAATRAWRLLPQRLPETERSLQPWLDIPLPLHPCWCDPWHDHVLFTSDRVSGLIDYGSVKEDHAAIDLARLLGSLVGDDYAAWEIALYAYRRVRPLTDQELALVAVLERAGVVNATVTWLRWLYHERRGFEDRASVAKRLQLIAERLDNQAAKIHKG